MRILKAALFFSVFLGCSGPDRPATTSAVNRVEVPATSLPSAPGFDAKPLYRTRFTYPEGWEVSLAAPGTSEGQHFYIADGRCEGRITGRLRGANHPQRRGDGTYLPDFQGVIVTDDG